MRSPAFIFRSHPVLILLSKSYSELLGRFSPVTHPFATKSIYVLLHRLISFDLHVLSTPPAFVLSQNQTLRKKIYERESSIAFSTLKAPCSNCLEPDRFQYTVRFSQMNESRKATHSISSCDETKSLRIPSCDGTATRTDVGIAQSNLHGSLCAPKRLRNFQRTRFYFPPIVGTKKPRGPSGRPSPDSHTRDPKLVLVFNPSPRVGKGRIKVLDTKKNVNRFTSCSQRFSQLSQNRFLRPLCWFDPRRRVAKIAANPEQAISFFKLSILFFKAPKTA